MLADLKDAKVVFGGGGKRRNERDRELGSHIGLGTKANGNRIPC